MVMSVTTGRELTPLTLPAEVWLDSHGVNRPGDAFNPLEMDKSMLRFTRMKKNIGMAAKLHELAYRNKGQNRNIVMVTLTYAPGAEWASTHMNAYITAVRMWLRRSTDQSLRYLWVAEMQQRGVIHYHVLFWLPKGLHIPKADKRGWWKHGSTNTVAAKAPVKYVMKYASKMLTKEGLPHGARCFGVGGLDTVAKSCRRWINFPSFIKGMASIADKWKRAVGGGWCQVATGQIFPSEWGMCLSTKRKLHIVRLYRHERIIEADGPFSWLAAS